MIERRTEAADQISFGPLRLLLPQKLLFSGDTPVRLGGRALDILIALVERPGETISKADLISRAWPNSFVDEGNLKVHVAALRKAIGDGQGGNRYIANVPGRGYAFVAPVMRSKLDIAAVAVAAPSERGRSLPQPRAQMFGRAETILALVALLQRHRLVTIVGPGGIGKTTVALAVANELVEAFQNDVHFVDLALITDPRLAPNAVAAAFGAPPHPVNPLLGLTSMLRDRRALIVLDNCEHVIEAVAEMTDALFKGAPGAHMLTTSREPLRVDGERVHRLAPLKSPPQFDRLMAAEALAYPAVQLFAERAGSGLESFELNDSNAPIVADICRRLDGIALAIEIVAGRADTFGVRGIAEQLDDKLRLTMRGRRTASSRHQTLNATLDWSFTLLPETERVIFRRLALFAGYFSLESATAVLAGAAFPTSTIVDGVSDLVAKSLVSTSLDGSIALHRLLDTTRAYAVVKLEESGEREAFAARHASHYRDLLERASYGWRRRPAAEWRENHQYLIDNVRAALDWSFSEAGDPSLGVALTVVAVPLWFQSSLTSECRERVSRALSTAPDFRNDVQEMELQAALAWSLMQTRGSVGETRAAWTSVLEIAERRNEVDYRLRAMWGLWAGLLNNSELRAALTLAERFVELAIAAKPADGPVGDRMVGYILHLIGDQARARRHIERMLDNYVAPTVGSEMIRYVFDQRAMSRCFLARILWLQGFPDRAILLVDEEVAAAISKRETLSLCQTLVQGACPLAILVGDLEKLQYFVGLLLHHSTKNALEFWLTWGRCFDGVLDIRRGELSEGLAKLRAALADLRAIDYGVYYIVFLGEYAEALGKAGRAAEALDAIQQALGRCRQNEEGWYLAELLRIEGELLFSSGGEGAIEAAEASFRGAMEVARGQETLSWELRAALSLARIWVIERRRTEALALISPLFGRFTEGFSTADFRASKQIMDDLKAE